MAVAELTPLSRPKRFGDRLLEAGLITRTQLDLALERQQAARETRARLGRTLVELGVLADRDLVQMLAIHYGLPPAASIAEPEAPALAALPATVACHCRALPFQLAQNVLRVAVTDAPTPALLDTLERCSARAVRLYVASDAELDAAVAKHYGHPQTVFPAHLRDLAVRLLRMAEEARVAALDHRLRAELERTREDIDQLVRLLAV